MSLESLSPKPQTPNTGRSTCGSIVRIKVLYNKRDSAFVQFDSPDMAQRAKEVLHGCPLWSVSKRCMAQETTSSLTFNTLIKSTSCCRGAPSQFLNTAP